VLQLNVGMLKAERGADENGPTLHTPNPTPNNRG